MTTENIKQIIHQPEGRRLEFKEQLSANSDIARSRQLKSELKCS